MNAENSLSYFRPNTIYCGDCKDVLTSFPENSIDLIYADPPFFSNRHYEHIWKDGYEIRAFEDRWKGGIEHYVAWMKPRLEACYRVLKPTGSLYLHCDWHAGAYLKVKILDGLFEERNFRNEVVWQRSDAHSDSKQGAQHYGRIHDTILFYTKSDDYIFNVGYNPLPKSTVDKWYRNVEKGTGRLYNKADLTAAKPGGDTSYEWHGKRPPSGRFWAYSKEKMKELDEKGLIVYSKSGKPYMKRYYDESKGVPYQDWWDKEQVEFLRGIRKGGERLGYPTQKPEALLERIIKVSSNPTDIVLDPFCGCGTAIAVAYKLGRRWVGIDISPTACNLMGLRFHKLDPRNYVNIVGMPLDEVDLRKLQHFDFQNWVVQRLHGRVSSRKTGEKGIDGYTIEGYPIQVKKSDRVVRDKLDEFETAMRRYGSKEGIFVAFSFTKGCYEEVARVANEEGLTIRLVTVEEIIEQTKKRTEDESLRRPYPSLVPFEKRRDRKSGGTQDKLF
jgi:DNA modification methylase